MSRATLAREAFKAAVFRRDRHRCVFCGAPAEDAHHIVERKLWPDGGYVLANGASVCCHHHWECETTALSVEDVRAACGIGDVALPPGLDPARRWDKWGNEVLPDSTRLRGPLWGDDGARRALARGGFLGLFVGSGNSQPSFRHALPSRSTPDRMLVRVETWARRPGAPGKARSV